MTRFSLTVSGVKSCHGRRKNTRGVRRPAEQVAHNQLIQTIHSSIASRTRGFNDTGSPCPRPPPPSVAERAIVRSGPAAGPNPLPAPAAPRLPGPPGAPAPPPPPPLPDCCLDVCAFFGHARVRLCRHDVRTCAMTPSQPPARIDPIANVGLTCMKSYFF